MTEDNKNTKKQCDIHFVTSSKLAEENAGEMMTTPMNELPELAIEFLKFISKKIGFCGETCFTAYVYYSTVVLKMKCGDKSYTASDWMNEWWGRKGYCL